MRHTARGDAPDLSADAMTRYYVNAGYPAGVWLGAGLAGVNDGAGLAVGSVVSEEQMARMFGAGFDHHDSRAGDPQLHTHVTIANRVQAASDGQWRTLDSRSLYAASVAHSDTYDLYYSPTTSPALLVSRGRCGCAAALATRAESWPPYPTS